MSFDAQETKGPGDAEGLVRAALREDFRTIAVIGGDGTLSESIRGFFEKPGQSADRQAVLPPPICPTASLAIVPGGTGNDFARGLTRSRAPFEMWTDKLIAHCQSTEIEKTTRAIDLIRVTVNGGGQRFICLNAATVGISAAVVTQVSRQPLALRVLPGEARFAMAALRALTVWRNREVRVTVDQGSIMVATNLIVIANGPYIGGGMKVIPTARPDDGRLEVIAANGISRTQALREFTRIHRGGHLANPKIVLKSGSHVRIDTLEASDVLPIEADGDVRGYTPAAFDIMPSSLRLVW